MNPEENIVERLIAIYDSANKTADGLSIALGRKVARQTVDMWRHKGVIPYFWGDDIEKATNGQIKAVEVWEAAARARYH